MLNNSQTIKFEIANYQSCLQFKYQCQISQNIEKSKQSDINFIPSQLKQYIIGKVEMHIKPILFVNVCQIYRQQFCFYSSYLVVVSDQNIIQLFLLIHYIIKFRNKLFMSCSISQKQDSFSNQDTIEKVSQRISKKEQIEMKRQLDVMINRVKMLAVFRQRLQGKQIQNEIKSEQVNSIRNEYNEYLKQVFNQSSIQQSKHKESREQSLELFREKTKHLKQQQQSLKIQIRQSVQQQKKEQFELMKKQSLNHDKVIILQKERSKSYNMEKKQRVQQYEQQQQVHLAMYKQQKQEQFKSQHKKAVLDSFKKKAQDFMKIQQLWEQEQDILDLLNDSYNSKLTSSMIKN
ncbi:unnamed protein product (macronuclear) [Paramecium tetraurelia]|uniref:Uncharacterized protein n=1 Tax=Paramecium tetraurelia TaxID=5888 RepID=A0DZK9_PARTE|nr:uncharacterized protein GSPATT00021644001 [Paramecium tetraurelia]CAK88476.1 unnamed protein product [Paramecium tetraurelia]|eukprot:XP_001455873.1 hypothetical protein (macronuclear) [Paramecium tetraurelia strain d4-2]